MLVRIKEDEYHMCYIINNVAVVRFYQFSNRNINIVLWTKIGPIADEIKFYLLYQDIAGLILLSNAHIFGTVAGILGLQIWFFGAT